MPFNDFGSPERLFNTYVFYNYLSMMLSKDPQVTQSCVATIKRLHMEFYALVFRICHRDVAENSYALIFKVPVINYGRVTGTQSLDRNYASD